MSKLCILLCCLYLLSCQCVVCVAMECFEGEKLHTPEDPQAGDVCVPCGDPKTFMSEKVHENRECVPCSLTQSPIEVVIRKCNSTHDTEIQCVPGYYRHRAESVKENDTCKVCRECESGFPARVCQGYSDTVCCPLQHDAVLDCQGKYQCKERPAPCGAGMYYNSSFERCMSCPVGTYMQAKSHTNRECMKCETLSENSNSHAVILHTCTRTSPALFGCEKNYFRGSDEMSLLEEVPCELCTICQQEVKQCRLLRDAVCAEESQGADHSSEEVTGITEDADTKTRGMSTLAGTLDSHGCNQFQNVTMHDSYDIVSISVICVTLLVLMLTTLRQIWGNGMLDAHAKRRHGAAASSRFTRRTRALTCIILSLALIVCLVLKTGAREILDRLTSDVLAIISIVAAEIYFAVLILTRCGCREPTKSDGNEDIQLGRLDNHGQESDNFLGVNLRTNVPEDDDQRSGTLPPEPNNHEINVHQASVEMTRE